MRRLVRFSVAIAAAVLTSATGMTTAGAALTPDWAARAGTKLGSVASDPTGAAVVTGTIVVDGDPELFVRKYDEARNVLWTRSWGPRGTRVNGLDVTVDDRGDVYVVGEIARANLEGGGYLLRKYSPKGRFLWGQVSAGGYVGGPDVPEVATGVSVYGHHIIVVGHRYGCCGSAADDGWIRSFRPDGALRWTRDFEVPDVPRVTNDVAVEVASDARGAYVVGSVETERRVDVSVRVDRELVVQKVSFSGERLWTYTLRDRHVRDEDRGTDVALGGGVYVVGEVNGRGPSDGEGFAARLDRDGRLDWHETWGAASDGISPSGVAVASGDPIVTGSMADPSDRTVDVFIRLIDADGSLNERVVDDAPRSRVASAIATGMTGVYVSGWLGGPGTPRDGRIWHWVL